MTTKESSTRAAESQKATAGEKRGPHDALQLLRADHRKVEDLFAQFEKARSHDRKERLATQICSELKVHTQVEEEIFYPAARQVLDSGDLLDEAAVEHGAVKTLIEQIEASGPTEPMYDAKVKVLSEYVKHHVKEEENELFPKLRKADIDLVALADALTERKAALVEGD